MCSGARSSSANAAMACLASVACSWSTSRRMVLSLWTIRGPSFTRRQLSRTHFLYCFDVDDPVDGEHPFGVLGGVEDPDPSAAYRYRNNGFQPGIPHAVHHIHGDPLLEPDGSPQGLQPQLRGFLSAVEGRAGTVPIGAGYGRVAAQYRELGGNVGIRRR